MVLHNRNDEETLELVARHICHIGVDRLTPHSYQRDSPPGELRPAGRKLLAAPAQAAATAHAIGLLEHDRANPCELVVTAGARRERRTPAAVTNSSPYGMNQS